MSIHKIFALGLVAGSLFSLGCTVEDPEVNNPEVNQNTDDDDEVIECKDACEETRTTCVADCDDDSCKATCVTHRDDCVGECDTE